MATFFTYDTGYTHFIYDYKNSQKTLTQSCILLTVERSSLYGRGVFC